MYVFNYRQCTYKSKNFYPIVLYSQSTFRCTCSAISTSTKSSNPLTTFTKLNFYTTENKHFRFAPTPNIFAATLRRRNYIWQFRTAGNNKWNKLGNWTDNILIKFNDNFYADASDDLGPGESWSVSTKNASIFAYLLMQFRSRANLR